MTDDGMATTAAKRSEVARTSAKSRDMGREDARLSHVAQGARQVTSTQVARRRAYPRSSVCCLFERRALIMLGLETGDRPGSKVNHRFVDRPRLSNEASGSSRTYVLQSLASPKEGR